MKLGSLWITAIALVACLPGCSEPERQPPPIDTLARTARLRIGPHRLHLPVVAIDRVERACAQPSTWPCGYEQQELARSATQGPALPVSSITVTLTGYSTFQDSARDESIAIPQLCGKLQQRWARRQCSGSDLFPDNLRRFTLLVPSALAQTNSLGGIGGQKEDVREVVRRLRPVGHAPALHCAPDGNGLCTAALRVSEGVLAVWVLADSDAGPGPLRRQATAIRAFVEHAAGEQEAYGQLIQALHQPG
jgi:hypothetical protein